MDAPISTRQNVTGQFAPTGPNRTSQIVTTIIPAGQTFPIFQAGTQFYITVSTGRLLIKPNNGSQNEFVQGTGLVVDLQNIFNQLQVSNPNSFNVVVQIFVGFGGYIDNRLIVSDPNQLDVVYPTYPVANVANQVLIPDLSGTSLLDLNGNSWLALSRKAIYISNVDNGVTLSLSSTDETKDVLMIQPLTDIVFPSSGNFSIKVPAANVNGIVSELYTVIRPV